ncbi:leucine-rich repeat domain-containing protein [Pedobacter mucosus]|uniref:leucine-rich repeat domain-containing protein n=1 Tax=Pedobacter mucosus TaxID=2895286 RepID=UPI001EE4B129|nr:leucine-rich repeat domain-containing protein [Pedobacter mucosus]UKT63554.1 leucine-rich repeat domain-containing protein [Pedobacter mucosus]
MKKKLLLFFLFICSTKGLYAQFSRFPYAAQTVFANDVSLLQYNNLTDSTVGLKLSIKDIKELDKYPKKLSSIIYLEFEFSNEEELKFLLETAAKFPNLKTIQFNGFPPYTDKKELPKYTIPDEILKLSQLNAIKFYGNSKLNVNTTLITLAKLPQLKHLIFNYGNFSDVPIELLELKNLELLQIGGQIKTLPGWFSEMKNLKSLRLESNSLDYNICFSVLSNLPNLTQLWIDNPKIKTKLTTPLNNKKLSEIQIWNGELGGEADFFASISASKNLSALIFINTSIKLIPQNISSVKKLTRLEITNNYNLALPNEIGKLRHLTFLKISSKMEELNPVIGKLKNLQNLNLSYNNLKTIPSQISKLRKLQYLALDNNKLVGINESVGFCSSLTQLNLSANPIVELPSSIGKLKKLIVLDVQHGNLNKIPNSIGNLQKLEKLDLNDNFITSIPESITYNKSLKTLNLSYNQLEELPAELGNLSALQDLQLSFNNIKNIPISIEKLKELKNFGLSFNNLDSLPHQISKLESLEELNLSTGRISEIKGYNYARAIYRKDDPNPIKKITANHIKNFPENLSHWTSLKKLNLANNNEINSLKLFKALFSISSKAYTLNLENCGVSFLPATGWERFYVKSLNLRNNQIREIPSEITKAPYLAEVNLNLNKLNDTPYNLNQYAGNKYEKLLWFMDLNIIKESILPASDSMVLALINKSNNHYYRKEFQQVVDLAKRAIKINDSLAMSKIFATNMGEASYEVGAYNDAINYMTKAIIRDTLGKVRIMNLVIPDFEFRAKSYLKLGDTLCAIKDYEILAAKFNGSWGEVGLLYKAINKPDQANFAYVAGIKKYQEQVDYLKKTKQSAELYQLSLLELMIIKEDFNSAKKYAYDLEKEFKLIQYVTLIRYLKASAEIGNNSFNIKNKPALLAFIKVNKQSISGWGYDLFFKWLKTTKISKEKLIREITDSIKP